jgi:hypothetical protein
VLALAPTLVALGALSGFVTQDGPAHVYNAHILGRSLQSDSPFRSSYAIRWSPLPNWAGHLVLMGLVAVFPPLLAERVVMTLTLCGVAISTLTLRIVVRGRDGVGMAVVYAALLSLNVSWLFGFHSFLFGASLFSLTLAYWWSGRHTPGPRWAFSMSVLMVLGYFCHLVSLGLTAVGLAVLALTTPGERYRARLSWTCVALLVLLPLAWLYIGITTEGGSFHPTWHELTSPISVPSWMRRISWVDPLTIGRRVLLPFGSQPYRAATLIQPVAWLSAALVGLSVASRWGGERRGWWLLGLLLLAVGLLGPDSFGPGHGDYLPQRVLLLGLLALAPAFDFETKRGGGWVATVALLGALVGQSAYVWDFALSSRHDISAILAQREAVGRNQRIGSLLVELRGRFRANVRLHADCLLGVGTGNVVWSNYEAAHYYFPVKFRPDSSHPRELEFEHISVMDDPLDAAQRRARWQTLLEEHHGEIDCLLILGEDSTLESIAERWFQREATRQRVQVWRHR